MHQGQKLYSQGVFVLRSASNFETYLNIAYTDAKYIDFSMAPAPVELTGGAVQFVDASGCRVPGISEWSLSYGFEYRIPHTCTGDFHVGVDGNLRSDFSSSPIPSRYMNVQGYALTNLRAGYRSELFEVFGWVRNAFDSEYFDFLTAASGASGLIVGQLGDLRTYGGTLKINF